MTDALGIPPELFAERHGVFSEESGTAAEQEEAGERPNQTVHGLTHENGPSASMARE